MARLKKHFHGRKRGTLLVEAAIMIPLVLMLTFVLIEGGWLMLKAEQIENAARQGARKAALSGSTTGDVDNVISTIMTSAGLPSYVKTYTPADPSTAKHGDPIQINVKVAYANISLTKVTSIFSYYGGTNTTPTYIGSTVTMTKE